MAANNRRSSVRGSSPEPILQGLAMTTLGRPQGGFLEQGETRGLGAVGLGYLVTGQRRKVHRKGSMTVAVTGRNNLTPPELSGAWRRREDAGRCSAGRR